MLREDRKSNRICQHYCPDHTRGSTSSSTDILRRIWTLYSKAFSNCNLGFSASSLLLVLDSTSKPPNQAAQCKPAILTMLVIKPGLARDPILPSLKACPEGPATQAPVHNTALENKLTHPSALELKITLPPAG